MWSIQATVTTEVDGWKVTRQVPTFYLNPRVQGIVSQDHAVSIARDILTVTERPSDGTTLSLSISAVLVDLED